MDDVDIHNHKAIALRLKCKIAKANVRVTLHAHQEMVAEEIALDDVVEALSQAILAENYPEHKRGACGLFAGRTTAGRFLHVVCTTLCDMAIIITVYEPKPPKWSTPFKRGKRDEM